MFFYLVSGRLEVTLKIGITRRLPKCRHREYQIFDMGCRFYKVVYFPNITLEQLLAIEKNCLAATKQYAILLDINPNNESRYDISPADLWAICCKYFPNDVVIYDNHETILQLTNKECPGVLMNEPMYKLHFKSIDELNDYVPVEPYKPDLPIKLTNLVPRKHQDINILLKYFENKNKGILWWAPGAGKTKFTIMWLIYLITRQLTKIIIGCPSVALIQMWQSECENYSIKVVNDINEFNSFDTSCILIIGYWDSSKIKNNSCDVLVLDECHHLASKSATNKIDVDDQLVIIADNEKPISLKPWQNILNVTSKYQLGLTATVKNIETKVTDGGFADVISNDDEKWFGSIIDTISIASAIKQNFIVDYKVCITYISQEDAENIRAQIESTSDLELILSAYIIMKMLRDNIISKALIYCNNRDNAKNIDNIITTIINKKIIEYDNMFYHNAIDSNMKPEIRNVEIQQFEQVKYGIITSVYIFGEGVDYPCVDCECFAEPMESTTRIVQAAMRGSRKFESNPNKINYLVLPIINTDEYLRDRRFSKIKQLIKKLNTVDKGVIDKITCRQIANSNRHGMSNKRTESKEMNSELIDVNLLSKITTLILSDIESTKDMTVEDFIKLLRSQKISNEKEYRDKYQYSYTCEIPVNPVDKYPKFRWDLLSNNDDTYETKECCQRAIDLLLKDDQIYKQIINTASAMERLQYLIDLDKRLPQYVSIKKLYKIEPEKLHKILDTNNCHDLE